MNQNENPAPKRENFASRLGFLLVSAGCAIGIGNVWRFPTVAGQNGGGVFVLFYLIFLLAMGVPVLTMELAVGRAGHGTATQAYRALEKQGAKWHLHGYLCLFGCCMLMMYYTTVSGWMLSYFFKFLTGAFSGLSGDAVSGVFGRMLESPGEMGGYMATRYLIEQGHRRIACLVNARRSNTGRKRLAGYERALREVGLPIDARLEFESEYYIPSAYEASEAVLATDATAVFASSDNIALGLLKRLHEMGKSIPGDISVVSYDNSAADVLFEPALTAIEQDPGVLAEHAFGCMSKRLAGRGGRRAEEVVLEPALIVKGSVLELTECS